MKRQKNKKEVGSLGKLRKRIDGIDIEIQQLIAERAEIAQAIGAEKGLTKTSEHYRPELSLIHI